jgi:hypothetical protein
MDTIYIYFAALNAARKVPAFVMQCRAILTRMAAVPALQTSLLAKTLADVNELDTAEQVAHKGSPAATKDRNAKLLLVRSDMRQLKAFVQSVADSDLANAQSIIESSGMSVGRRAIRVKPNLAAKQGKVTTLAEVYARAVKGRVSYEWQMSTDQKTWSDLPRTVKAQITVTGLTPATIYYFRFRTLTVAGLSDWSMVASVIAH